MNNILHRLSILIVALTASLSMSAAISFTLVPPRAVIEGRKFQLTFVLSTGDQQLSYVPEINPSRPQIQGCEFYSGPGISTGHSSYGYYTPNSSSSQETYSINYQYTYIARHAGKTTIPSVSVTVGGRTYKTKATSIEVVKDNAPQSPAYGGAQGQVRPQQGGGGSSSQSISVGKVKPSDLMVNISFSRQRLYEQEPVIATIKLYVKYDKDFTIDGNTFKVNKLPVFDGFLSEELPVKQGGTVENYKGQVYYVFEIKRVLLYPQKSGDLTVHSGEYEITVIEYEMVTYGWARTRREVPRHMNTATNSASIHIDPLPEPRPANFSGAVGNFSAQSSLAPELLRTNEAATYTLTIKGSGNIKFLTAPKIEFPSTFDAYTSKTDINANFNGSTHSGTYTIEYPIVPQEVGKYVIEPYQFVYFNPSTKKYETIETKGFKADVVRGSGSSTEGAQKVVDATMRDIRHIHLLSQNMTTLQSSVIGTWWYKMIYLLAIVALITAIITYRRYIKQSADVAGRRLARANRLANKRLKSATKFMSPQHSEQFYNELANALRGYIGDKLSMPPSQLISDTISDKLTAYGASSDAAQSVIDVLNDCEMARFTPTASDSSAMKDIYDRAASAIKSIEDIKTK